MNTDLSTVTQGDLDAIRTAREENDTRAREQQLSARYKYFVIANMAAGGGNRIVIHTNSKDRASAILSALNDGRIYMKSEDGDFDYYMVCADLVGGKTVAEVLRSSRGATGWGY